MFTETSLNSNYYWSDSTYNIEEKNEKNEKLSGTLETI